MHISVMRFHKPIAIYMGALILGINTLYILFCFFKLFLIVGKGLALKLTRVHREKVVVATYILAYGCSTHYQRILYFTVAAREKQQFSASLEGMRHASSHVISHENVYQDVMDLYSSSASTIIKEPLQVTFEGEMALDAGGVCRDMFSAFWEAACNEELFSGSNHIIPAVHPQVEMSKFGIMGTILSHGYLTCGFLPSRLPLPLVILALLGPNTSVDDGILLKAFLDYVVSYEQEELMVVFQDIRCTSVLSSANRDRLVSILNHFNCTRMPTVDNMKKLLLDIARNEFCVKPAGALHAIHAGVPIPHIRLWKSHSVQ